MNKNYQVLKGCCRSWNETFSDYDEYYSLDYQSFDSKALAINVFHDITDNLKNDEFVSISKIYDIDAYGFATYKSMRKFYKHDNRLFYKQYFTER